MADKKPNGEVRDYTPKPPKQVQEQIAQADAIRAELQGTPPAAPAEGGEAAQQQDAPPVAATPPQPVETGTPPSGPPAEDESWEQRFKSQQGRLEQANKSNQQLLDRLNELEKQVTTLQIKGAEPEAPPEPRQKPRYLSDQEINDYGEELLSVVGKRAKEEYAPEFDQLAERLKRLEGRLDGVGTVIEKSQVNDVYAGLSANVPHWKDINRSEHFKSWLQELDPYSGRKRHDMLTEAFSRHEAGRVVSFFRGFLSEAVGTPPDSSSPGTSAPPPVSDSGSGKPSLEQFAAPGRARSAPQELPPDKPIYTAAWIARFTADKIAGKYRGREADAEAIEQDIYRAQHEGRIQ